MSGTSEVLKAAYQILTRGTGNKRASHDRLGKQTKGQYSNSLGVGIKQRQKLVEHLKSQGLGHIEVDYMGRPKFNSERERRKLARAMDHIGMDSYYD